MSGLNAPSSAGPGRSLEAAQGLKRNVQAAFDGTAPLFLPFRHQVGLLSVETSASVTTQQADSLQCRWCDACLLQP